MYARNEQPIGTSWYMYEQWYIARSTLAPSVLLCCCLLCFALAYYVLPCFWGVSVVLEIALLCLVLLCSALLYCDLRALLWSFLFLFALLCSALICFALSFSCSRRLLWSALLCIALLFHLLWGFFATWVAVLDNPFPCAFSILFVVPLLLFCYVWHFYYYVC